MRLTFLLGTTVRSNDEGKGDGCYRKWGIESRIHSVGENKNDVLNEEKVNYL